MFRGSARSLVRGIRRYTGITSKGTNGPKTSIRVASAGLSRGCLAQLEDSNVFDTQIKRLSIATLRSDGTMPRLITMENGEKAQLTFSQKEMKNRLAMLRDHMRTNEIGGVLLTSMHNVKYFSDFLYCAFGRNYGLVVTMDKEVLISAYVDGGQPWRRSFASDNVIYTDWHRDNFWFAVQQELSEVSGKIGYECDQISVDARAKLEQAVGDKQIVDVGETLMQKRIVKSAEEIALITEGARICDVGGEAVIEVIDEGVAEYEVALHATNAMVREVAKTFPHTEVRDTWAWIQSGINSDGAHNPTTTRRLQKGDIISMNTFPMFAGYYAALERTLFLDHVPTDRHMELWELNCGVHRRGMELIKPGVKLSEIAHELNEIYIEHDLLRYKSIGYGHAIGLVCHHYGREAALEIREDIETVLLPGMVLSMEPMLTVPENEPGAGAYREHNIMVVTEDGATNITHFPVGPEHNIIKK